MNINKLSESKYLKKEDLDGEVTVKITGIDQVNLAMENEPPEYKYILLLQDMKPLVLNVTNANLIAHVLKSEETDDWMGKQIVLYNDPSVQYQGKMIGGIRVRPTPAKDIPF